MRMATCVAVSEARTDLLHRALRPLPRRALRGGHVGVTKVTTSEGNFACSGSCADGKPAWVTSDQDFERLLDAMKKAGGALQQAGVPYLLGGGLACWARGGPKTEHDVDLLVKPEDAERAQDTLARAGLRTETPPEGWLLKAHDGDVLIDLIYDPQGGPVDDQTFERAEELEVHAMRMKVAALEDVLVQKLLALKEQEPDYSSVLELARALREQVNWDEVRERTSGSPFAKAYFTLLDELEIVPA
jgi:predicted nucleotidyltransferase